MLHDLPTWDRPREKLLNFGASSLTNSELIAILINSGSKSESALSLASKIISLEQDSLSQLSGYDPHEFMKLDGIGVAKACTLVAAMELGRRIATSPKKERAKITKGEDVAHLFMEEMRHLNQEVVKIAMLDIQNRLISKSLISVGGLSEATSNPREVFAPAIKKGAASIIVVHNHPSGECNPSEADLRCTKQLAEAGQILGVPLLDHIIIGDNCYVSLYETHRELF